MPAIMDAADVYATVGEISDRLRAVFGEHREGKAQNRERLRAGSKSCA